MSNPIDPSVNCVVAIVGAGYTAREHIRAFQDIPGTIVAGIHSRTRVRAEALAAEFGIPAVCDSIPELFERTAAKLVVVTVPELSTNAVCCSCFAHGWTVLIEKPAGYDVADAESIAAAARSNGRRAYVALNRRQYGSTRAVISDLATQGGPRLIKIQDQENPAAALRGGQPQLVVDNWMYANSIHLIDYFTFLGRGAIVEVTPVIRWNPREPRYVAAKISYDSGDVGLYEAVWNGPGPWTVTVTTPDKRWEMRPVEKAAYNTITNRTLVAAEDDPQDTKFKPGFRRQAELAVQVAMGGEAALPTLEDGLASMRLTQAIYATE